MDRKAHLCSILRSVSKGAAWTAICLGTTGLAGWVFDVQALKVVIRGFPLMVPNTAIAFLLGGVSLLVRQQETCGIRFRRAAELCAIGVTLLGALTVYEYLFDRNTGIDLVAFGT